MRRFSRSPSSNATSSAAGSPGPPSPLPPLTSAVAVGLRTALACLDSKALQQEGLYRLSGRSDDVTTLARAIEDGTLTEDMLAQCNDPHAVAGAVKRTLRDHAPLIPYAFYDAFCSKGANLVELRRQLPPLSERVLERLLQHLRNVIAHSDVNRMTAPALARVVGMNIARRSEDAGIGDLEATASLFLRLLDSSGAESREQLAERSVKVSWRVGDVPPSEQALQEAFRAFGEVEHVALRGRSAAVLMRAADAAAAAVQNYKGACRVKPMSAQPIKEALQATPPPQLGVEPVAAPDADASALTLPTAAAVSGTAAATGGAEINMGTAVADDAGANAAALEATEVAAHTVTQQALPGQQLALGDHIEVKRPDNSGWSLAVVCRVRGDGSCDVEYEDGAKEKKVSPSSVRVVAKAKTGTGQDRPATSRPSEAGGLLHAADESLPIALPVNRPLKSAASATAAVLAQPTAAAEQELKPRKRGKSLMKRLKRSNAPAAATATATATPAVSAGAATLAAASASAAATGSSSQTSGIAAQAVLLPSDNSGSAAAAAAAAADSPESSVGSGNKAAGSARASFFAMAVGRSFRKGRSSSSATNGSEEVLAADAAAAAAAAAATASGASLEDKRSEKPLRAQRLGARGRSRGDGDDLPAAARAVVTKSSDPPNLSEKSSEAAAAEREGRAALTSEERAQRAAARAKRRSDALSMESVASQDKTVVERASPEAASASAASVAPPAASSELTRAGSEGRTLQDASAGTGNVEAPAVRPLSGRERRSSQEQHATVAASEHDALVNATAALSGKRRSSASADAAEGDRLPSSGAPSLARASSMSLLAETTAPFVAVMGAAAASTSGNGGGGIASAGAASASDRAIGTASSAPTPSIAPSVTSSAPSPGARARQPPPLPARPAASPASAVARNDDSLLIASANPAAAAALAAAPAAWIAASTAAASGATAATAAAAPTVASAASSGAMAATSASTASPGAVAAAAAASGALGATAAAAVAAGAPATPPRANITKTPAPQPAPAETNAAETLTAAALAAAREELDFERRRADRLHRSLEDLQRRSALAAAAAAGEAAELLTSRRRAEDALAAAAADAAAANDKLNAAEAAAAALREQVVELETACQEAKMKLSAEQERREMDAEVRRLMAAQDRLVWALQAEVRTAEGVHQLFVGEHQELLGVHRQYITDFVLWRNRCRRCERRLRELGEDPNSIARGSGAWRFSPPAASLGGGRASANVSNDNAYGKAGRGRNGQTSPLSPPPPPPPPRQQLQHAQQQQQRQQRKQQLQQQEDGLGRGSSEEAEPESLEEGGSDQSESMDDDGGSTSNNSGGQWTPKEHDKKERDQVEEDRVPFGRLSLPEQLARELDRHGGCAGAAGQSAAQRRPTMRGNANVTYGSAAVAAAAAAGAGAGANDGYGGFGATAATLAISSRINGQLEQQNGSRAASRQALERALASQRRATARLERDAEEARAALERVRKSGEKGEKGGVAAAAAGSGAACADGQAAAAAAAAAVVEGDTAALLLDVVVPAPELKPGVFVTGGVDPEALLVRLRAAGLVPADGSSPPPAARSRRGQQQQPQQQQQQQQRKKQQNLSYVALHKHVKQQQQQQQQQQRRQQQQQMPSLPNRKQQQQEQETGEEGAAPAAGNFVPTSPLLRSWMAEKREATAAMTAATAAEQVGRKEQQRRQQQQQEAIAFRSE